MNTLVEKVAPTQLRTRPAGPFGRGPVEMLEPRTLLSAVIATAAIAGTPLPTNQAYAGVVFFGPLASFAPVPAITPGDPLTDEPSVRIAWADGTPPTIIPSSQITAGDFPAGAAHVYAQPGTYPATVSFFEGKTLQTSTPTPVTVGTASSGGVTNSVPRNQLFNGVVATFSDAGQLAPAGAATIDWGDGHMSPGTVITLTNTTYQVSGTQFYAVPGIHPVQVTANFYTTNPSLTHPVTIDSTIIVHRLNGSAKPPKIVGTASAYYGVAGEGAPEIDPSFTGVPYEPNNSQYTATIRWSGGIPATTGSLYFDPDLQILDVTVDSPVFQHPGRYSADVRLYRGEQLIGQVRVPFTIRQNSLTGLTLTPTANRSFTHKLGTFEAGFDDDPQQQPNAVTIDWGDGTTSAATFTQINSVEVSPGDIAGIFAVTGSHLYAKPGRYRIQVLDATEGDPTPAVALYDTAIVRKPVK